MGPVQKNQSTSLLALQLSPAQLQHSEGLPLSSPPVTANPVLQQMLALEESGRREVKRLSQLLAPLPDSGDIPSGRLGQQVALALRLIATGACPPVLQMAQGGHDTHANQLVRHERALGELAPPLPGKMTPLHFDHQGGLMEQSSGLVQRQGCGEPPSDVG